MKIKTTHKTLVTIGTVFGASILLSPLASASITDATRLDHSPKERLVEPAKMAQNNRNNDRSRQDRGQRRQDRQRSRDRGRNSQERQRSRERNRSRERSRGRNNRSRQHEHNRRHDRSHRRDRYRGYNTQYNRRNNRRYNNSYGRHRTNYRSNIGINFFFGSPGYSSYRWASSPYSFYRPGYWSYNDYQARTHCERITVEANHYDHTELISVKQCYNPYDGYYIIQGSERIVDCPYANTRW